LHLWGTGFVSEFQCSILIQSCESLELFVNNNYPELQTSRQGFWHSPSVGAITKGASKIELGMIQRTTQCLIFNQKLKPGYLPPDVKIK